MPDGAEVSPFPVLVSSQGSRWYARPNGDAASTRLVSWLAGDAPLPEGFRVSRGAGDGGPVAASERPIDVDQTNSSVIVGDRLVVKWATGPLVGPHPAPERLRRLQAAGFAAMPTIRGALEWCTPDGYWVPVVTVTDLIHGATDGWTWCLHEARVALGVDRGPERPFATELGELTAAMHLALADSATGPVAVHGDFHVGQLLRGADGRIAVVDFDGNPTLDPEQRAAHRPAAYDVAGMLLSLENVGHVLLRYHPEVDERLVIAWTEAVQRAFLDAYRGAAGRLLDESLVSGYIDDQIRREFDYAAAHLPAWRYVPEAALRRRGVP